MSTLDILQACETCGICVDERHVHHILPRSLGGTDYPTNLVRICVDCHNTIHGAALGISSLIRQGLRRAVAQGTRLGAPVRATAEKVRQVQALRRKGLGYKAISAAVCLSVGLCHKICEGLT